MNNQTTNTQNKKTIVRRLTDTSTAKKTIYTAEQLADILANIHRLATATDTETAETATTDRPDLYAERNTKRGTDEQPTANIDLLNYVAITATYKTLNYLASHGATYTETADDVTATKKDDVSPLGYNMAVKLLKDLPHDIATYKHTDTTTAYTDSIDILQEVFAVLVPFVCSNIEITPETVIYTKTLKNGNEKDYTLFSLACLTIRRYIQGHAQRNYKRLAYIVGYTDEGNAVYSTKRPADDLADIDTAHRTKFLNHYDLTAREQEIINHYINGLSVAEIADKIGATFEGTKKALYRAKQAIKETAKQDKMIK